MILIFKILPKPNYFRIPWKVSAFIDVFGSPLSLTPWAFPLGAETVVGVPRDGHKHGVAELCQLFCSSLCPAVHREGRGWGEVVPEAGCSPPGAADGEPRGLTAPRTIPGQFPHGIPTFSTSVCLLEEILMSCAGREGFTWRNSNVVSCPTAVPRNVLPWFSPDSALEVGRAAQPGAFPCFGGNSSGAEHLAAHETPFYSSQSKTFYRTRQELGEKRELRLRAGTERGWDSRGWAGPSQATPGPAAGEDPGRGVTVIPSSFLLWNPQYLGRLLAEGIFYVDVFIQLLPFPHSGWKNAPWTSATTAAPNGELYQSHHRYNYQIM